MRLRRLFLVGPGLLAWSLAFGFSACESPSNESGTGEAGAGGEADRALGEGGEQGDAGAAGTGGAGGTPGEPADGGAAGEAGLVGGAGGVGGEGGAGGGEEKVVCDQTVADPPDDEFRDTNCDGIDGEAAHAVFVSATGDDSALGTMSAPVRSINRAIRLATESKAAVYVCNGTYNENVFIERGIGVFGGYNCERDWIREKDRAIVRVEGGQALTIDSVAEAVVLDRIAFRVGSADPNAFGATSQAGAISNSTHVVLSHVEFAAGDGAPGIQGLPGVDAPTAPPSTGGAGADAGLLRFLGCDASSPTPGCTTSAPGGSGATAACQFDDGVYWVEGGKGGDGANLWLAQGKPPCLNQSLGNGVSAGTSVSGATGGAGRIRLPGRSWTELSASDAGRAGKDGTSGGGARAGIGSLRGGLYFATNDGNAGTWGEPGRPGIGGTGGVSDSVKDFTCTLLFTPGSGGGQGGVGGCGGGPASPGTAGGGSIGVVIANSHVEVNWVSISTGHGGNGGAGAAGGRGQPGGAPGLGGAAVDNNRGEDGAPGGDGGLGGASGPGGGGPSIGILYVGTAPKVTEGTFDIGVPGSGGALAGGGAAPIGVTGELYQLPK